MKLKSIAKELASVILNGIPTMLFLAFGIWLGFYVGLSWTDPTPATRYNDSLAFAALMSAVLVCLFILFGVFLGIVCRNAIDALRKSKGRPTPARADGYAEGQQAQLFPVGSDPAEVR